MDECRDESGVYAVALLILLARTAWTRLVASGLRLIADDCFDLAVFLARGRRALVWTSETQRCLSTRASLLQRLRRLFRNNLQIEERSNRRRIDAVEHLLE